MTVRDTRPTILVVDDNPQIRSFLRPALEDAGFACLEAADGAEAVYHAEAARPDLIVLDIELGDPVMDGLDVCRQIRALDLDMPVIFLTVRATVQDMESGLRVAGPGSDYVRKLEELRRLQLGGASPSRDRLRNPEGHRAPTGHEEATVSERSPEGLLYECKNCGRVFQAQTGQQRQECPSCHSDAVEAVDKAPGPRPGLLQRLLRRRPHSG